MSVALFFFPEKFQLWAYDVSHGRLLLRHYPLDGKTRRVDILFGDVRLLNINIFFDSIEVRELGEKESFTGGFPGTRDPKELEPGLKRFRIQTHDWVGLIVAAGVIWHEDFNDFRSPSSIYRPGPLMKRLAANGYELD